MVNELAENRGISFFTNKVATKQDVLECLNDGQVIMIDGFLNTGTPEALVDALIEKKFKNGSPKILQKYSLRVLRELAPGVSVQDIQLRTEATLIIPEVIGCMVS